MTWCKVYNKNYSLIYNFVTVPHTLCDTALKHTFDSLKSFTFSTLKDNLISNMLGAKLHCFLAQPVQHIKHVVPPGLPPWAWWKLRNHPPSGSSDHSMSQGARPSYSPHTISVRSPH